MYGGSGIGGIRRHHHGATPVNAYGVLTAGVDAWYKRDTLSGNTNGANISTWTDSGPNGLTLTKDAGSGQPLWDTTVLGGSIAFAGVSAFTQLTNTQATTFLDTSHLTVFMVARWDLLANGRSLLSAPNGSLNVGFWYSNATGVTMNCYVGGGGANNNVNFPYSDTTNPHVFEMTFDGSQATNAAKMLVHQDGTLQTETFGGTMPASTGHTSGPGFTIAAANGTTSAACHIAELLVYRTTLSAADRSTIRAALGAKYSITVV